MTQLSEQERVLVTLISEECNTPAEITAKLKGLFAGVLEKMLEAEMDEHLGYEKNDNAGDNSENSRNGYGKKRIKSEWGESEIAVIADDMKTIFAQLHEIIMANLFETELSATTAFPTCEGIEDAHPIPMAVLQNALSIYEGICSKQHDFLPQFYSAAVNIFNKNYEEPKANVVIDDIDLPF